MYKDVHFFAMVSVPLLKILNVSKIRLRLICARASYLHCLLSKALILIQLFLGCISSFLYVLGIFAVYFLFNTAYTALEQTLFIDLPTNGYKDNAHYGFSKYSNEPFAGLMANAPSFPGTFASLRFIFSHAIYYLPLFCFCDMGAGKIDKLKGGEKV